MFGQFHWAFEGHLIFLSPHRADDFLDTTTEPTPSADRGGITMPAKDQSTCTSSLDVKEILRELEVPFSPDQVQWRVTVTAKDRRRGQIVPYADPRAYTDRLNALRSPQGWTRDYRVETMSNTTRKGGKHSLGQSVRHLYGHYFRPVVALGNG